MVRFHFFWNFLPAFFWVGGGAQYIACSGTTSTIADGLCDPANNNIECGYDGGDCCECTCSRDRSYPCGFEGFECRDASAGDVTRECQNTTSSSRRCSMEYDVHDWVVNDTASAISFTEAANCTGGTFNVTWKGRVILDRTIYVEGGTTIHLTGADPESEVDGGGIVRLFTLVNASLHLVRMRLSNGNATYGGAIAATISKITLNQSIFNSNTAASVAGALYLDRSLLVALEGQAVFAGNSASSRGGALVAARASNVSWSGPTSFFNNIALYGGGAIYIHGSIISWSAKTSFANNTVDLISGVGGAIVVDEFSNVSWSAETSFVKNSGGWGGALGVDGGSSVAWAAETSFFNNIAGTVGGALYIDGGSGVSWLAESFFINNSGGFGGALIVLGGSNVSWVAQTVFINNNAATGSGGALHVQDGCSVWWGGASSFIDNAAPWSGGALFVYGDSNVYWTAESSFVNNNAGNSGGAIRINNFSDVSWSAETSFFNNTAGENGGALRIENGSGVSWSAETSFINNRGDFGGALVVLDGSDVSWVNQTVFINNNASAGSGGALYIHDWCNVWWGGASSFIDNAATWSGGALFVYGDSNVYWTAESSFVNNNAGNNGGAIRINNFSDVSWSAETSFFNNTAGENGGALRIENGSGVSWSAETSFINNRGDFGGALVVLGGSDVSWVNQTVFINNNASAGSGGALYIHDWCNVWWGGASSFIDNAATWSGGALFVYGDSSVYWTAESSFVNNNAGNNGGAIRINNFSDVSWSAETSFFNNTAGENGGALRIENGSGISWSAETSFINNRGDFGGALVVLGGSDVSWVNQTVFINNNASAGSGGALYIHDWCNVWWGGASSFIDNAATWSGGALFVYGDSNVYWTAESSFVNNNAGNNGGAIRINNFSDVSWSAETSFFNNTAGENGGALRIENGSGVSWSAETSFINNRGDFGGALVVLGGSDVSWVNQTVFINNNASAGSGGAFYIQDWCNVWWGGASSFIDNAANWSGGALYVFGDSSVYWAAESSFVNNNAGNNGGALSIRNISSVSWSAETSVVNNSGDIGGGLYINEGSSVSWAGKSSFVNNNARENGGALFVFGGSSVSWIAETFFEGNVANIYGGAIVVSDESRASWEASTTFLSNSATSFSGGAVVLYGNCSISWGATTSFIGNMAGAQGGALASLISSTVTMEGDTVFVDNFAGLDGGAAYIYHSDDQEQSLIAIYSKTVFTNNKCEANGGGIALIGSVSTVLATTNMTFSGNNADVAGGAIYASGAVFGPKFVGTRFVSNSAEMGGGVYTTGSGIALVPNILGVPEPQDPFTFIKCQFIGNKASTRGGALDSGAGIDLIVDSLFVGNTAGSGGALRLAGEASLDGCEFVENSSGEDKGPAVYNEGFVSNISDCRFVDNVYNCDPNHFFVYDELDVLSGTVCKDCDLPCEKCDFEGREPMCIDEIEHSSSPGGNTTVELLLIEHGYWRASKTSTNILACYNEDACQGGVTGTKDYCLGGYEGPYCSVCSDGYTPALGSSCNKCSHATDHGIALVVVLGVVFFVGFASFLAYMLSGQTQNADRGIVARLSRFIPLHSLKIVVVVWQILTQFCDVVNFAFPSIYQEFLDGVELLNFDFSWIISTRCIVDIDFHDRLLISTIGPIIGMAILGVTFAAAIHRHRDSEAACHVVRRKHLSMVLLLTFLVYSSVSTTVFTMFVCDDLDDGTSYLRADYRIDCDSSDHEALEFYAGFMLVVYAVGIPTFYASLLFVNHDTLTRDGDRENNDSVTSFADLWKPYKPRCFFYEVIECCRRVLLTGVVVFVYPDSAAQIAVALMMATAFLVLSEALAPYFSPWDSLVNRMGHVIVVTSMFLALLLKVDVSKEKAGAQRAFESVLVAVHVVMILVVIVEAGAMIVAWRKENVSEDSTPRYNRRSVVASESFADWVRRNAVEDETL